MLGNKDLNTFLMCAYIALTLFKSVMESFERSPTSLTSSVFTPPAKSIGSPVQPAKNSTRLSTMRPLATAYKASTSDYQVL